jgi:hypothetical protein
LNAPTNYKGEKIMKKSSFRVYENKTGIIIESVKITMKQNVECPEKPFYFSELTRTNKTTGEKSFFKTEILPEKNYVFTVAPVAPVALFLSELKNLVASYTMPKNAKNLESLIINETPAESLNDFYISDNEMNLLTCKI